MNFLHGSFSISCNYPITAGRCFHLFRVGSGKRLESWRKSTAIFSLLHIHCYFNIFLLNVESCHNDILPMLVEWFLWLEKITATTLLNSFRRKLYLCKVSREN